MYGLPNIQPEILKPSTTAPLIERITQTSYSCPSEWALRTKEGKMIFVKFSLGKLDARFDNRWSGEEYITIDFPMRRTRQYMSTAEMIAQCGFRLNHDEDTDG